MQFLSTYSTILLLARPPLLLFQPPTDNRSFTVFSLLHACYIFQIFFIIKISLALSSDLLIIYLAQYTTNIPATELKNKWGTLKF
jgi:hypothetical protein